MRALHIVLLRCVPQVKLLQGGANPFKATLGPSDELRVSYINAWKTTGASGELIDTTTLELLPDRIPVDLADSISVELPMWAFRPIPGASTEPGSLRYRADLVLTASRTSFGGKRKLLSTPRRLSKLIEASAAADDTARALLAAPAAAAPAAVAASAPGSCATNSRPQQQCPTGWDKATKQFLPKALATTPVVNAAAVSTRKGASNRKGPSHIPGTVSALMSRNKAAAGVAAKSVSTAAVLSAGGACAGGLDGFGTTKPHKASLHNLVGFLRIALQCMLEPSTLCSATCTPAVPQALFQHMTYVALHV
jgi:hypothetical protein